MNIQPSMGFNRVLSKQPQQRLSQVQFGYDGPKQVFHIAGHSDHPDYLEATSGAHVQGTNGIAHVEVRPDGANTDGLIPWKRVDADGNIVERGV